MIDWDTKLLEKLKRLNMVPELYNRFKDDIDIVIESLEKGTRLLEEIVVDESKKLEDENKSHTNIDILFKEQQKCQLFAS
jgi:hypothetical protein